MPARDGERSRAAEWLAHLRPGRGPLRLALNFSAHVATGFIAVAVHYSIMALCLHLGVGPIASSSVGFIGGALTRFMLSYFGVFEPTRGMSAAGSRFVIAVGLQLLANSALLATLMHAGMAVWWAQITTTVALTFVNYVVHRFWVFR